MNEKQKFRFDKSFNFRELLKEERRIATKEGNSGSLGELKRVEDELKDYVETGKKGEHLKAIINFKKVKINFVEE